MSFIKSFRQLGAVERTPARILPTFARYASTENAKSQETKKEEPQQKAEEKTNEKAKEEPKQEQAKPEETAEKKPEPKKEETAEQKLEKKNKALEEKILKSEEDIKELNKKLEQSINKYKYQLAENDNTVKRYKEEVRKAGDFSITKFAKDLLEVRDSLQLAINYTQKVDIEKEEIEKLRIEFKNLCNGVTMTSTVFDKTMKRFNVEEFNPVGEKFDPNFHEAVAMIDDPTKEPGTV